MMWISNVNRQSILPILFGISLTTFGLSVAVLLYTMLEKDDNDDDDDDNRKKNDRVPEVSIKIHEKHVRAIIGKRGATIRNLEELTDTRIRMEVTASGERFCHIYSNNKGNVTMAHSRIQDIISNSPVIETFEMFVPFEASKRIFGRDSDPDGALEQKLSRKYGVKVTVENDSQETLTGLMRKVILKGTEDQLIGAINEIEYRVEDDALRMTELEAEEKKRIAAAKIFMNPKKNTIARNNRSDSVISDYVLPYDVYKGIIEEDECVIQKIEKLSGAKITFGGELVEYTDTYGTDYFDNRTIIINGTAKQVALAKSLMEVQHASESQQCKIELSKLSKSSLCDEKSEYTINTAVKDDGLMQVYVSAVKTPSQFWIQISSRSNVDFQQLTCEMTEYYNDPENRERHTLDKIMIGQIVAAELATDNKWVRAEVTSFVDSSKCEIFFVDYGDFEIIPKADIFELRTDMLCIRQQAIECSLAHVKPQEGVWPTETIDKFVDLVNLGCWKPFVAKVRGYKERSNEKSRRQNSLIPCIDLYENVDEIVKIDIADKLIQLGMAQIEEEVHLAANSLLLNEKNNFSFIPFLPDSYNLD